MKILVDVLLNMKALSIKIAGVENDDVFNSRY
jgi:hypothetical protein